MKLFFKVFSSNYSQSKVVVKYCVVPDKKYGRHFNWPYFLSGTALFTTNYFFGDLRCTFFLVFVSLATMKGSLAATCIGFIINFAVLGTWVSFMLNLGSDSVKRKYIIGFHISYSLMCKIYNWTFSSLYMSLLQLYILKYNHIRM